MPVYWTVASIPELADLPAARRRAIWRDAIRAVFRRGTTWAGLLLLPLTSAAGIEAALALHPDAAVPAAAVGGGLGGLGYSQFVIARARPLLRAARAREV